MSVERKVVSSGHVQGQPAAAQARRRACPQDGSLRSIRHYDDNGLLSSVRAANGYRWFPPSAVTQVRQIRRLIAAGFSVAEIRGFPDCIRLIEGAACPETAEVHRRRLASIERQITELEARRARLRRMLAEGT